VSTLACFIWHPWTFTLEECSQLTTCDPNLLLARGWKDVSFPVQLQYHLLSRQAVLRALSIGGAGRRAVRGVQGLGRGGRRADHDAAPAALRALRGAVCRGAGMQGVR
jgi:hypothetical protein